MKNPVVVLLACLTAIVLLIGVLTLPATAFSSGVPVEEGDRVSVLITDQVHFEGTVTEIRGDWIGMTVGGNAWWIRLEQVAGVKVQ